MTTAPVYVRLGRHRNSSPKVTSPRLRLVCFGFAGGTITSLLSLAEAFPSWIEVWGAEYSGRGMRWRSPLIERIDPLLDDLSPGLARLSDLPIAMLGYSMGAHMAYRLALKASCAPVGVVVISARPPHRKVTDWPPHRLSDRELVARLRALGGMPAEILDNCALMESFMPVVRADLALCLDMNRFLPVRLPCPLFALQGADDRLLLDAEVPRWLDVAGGTEGKSKYMACLGGHFLHKGRETAVALAIADWLGTLIPEHPPMRVSLELTPALSDQ